MDEKTREHLNNLHSRDADLRYASFHYLIQLTQQPVNWAYEVWDELLALLRNGDNHQRAIAAQLLSNLAKSDSQKRMLNHLDQLIAVTKDEKFVTARHSLQSLWKVGVASEDLKKMVVENLGKRFIECIDEKNCSLIRYDILEVLRKMYDQLQDEKLKDIALTLIEKEEDPKYRKKYAGLWKRITKKASEKKP
ncbi:MAG: hypothetical protein H7122_14775 [Chitinophagaceae bacterium]|nr:hypothetical protein [Chitinophagaceae bacterium]